MVEVNSYFGQQYQAYASLLATLAVLLLLYLTAHWLSPRLAARGVPAPWLPRLVLFAGTLYLIYRVFDLLLRRNDAFDEYAWPVAPTSLDDLDQANQPAKFVDLQGLPSICAGSYCCGEGTEWVDEKGCVVSASPPKPASTLNASLLGQDLTAKLKEPLKP